MAIKRSVEEAGASAARPRRQHLKRIKISPTHEDTDNSSEASSGSVSEDSALRSSPQPSDPERNSSMSSLEPSAANGDDDSESSISSTSSEDSEIDSDSETEITTIGQPKKPPIHKQGLQEGAQDLRSRLSSFLPQMAEANRLLADKSDGYSLEEVGEDEQHIEMNLGLGVLEQQGEEDAENSLDESSDEEDVGEELPAFSEGVNGVKQDREADVLGKLMGQDRKRQKVGIQEAD
ncbi:uncharacterized protein LTR77_007289 [Saxophila tyrrhenica]|uniref:Uncharacterized protein n=1 Tax=Saxophila tyrrhenica TaxID=1690608 RepID=A0AAV9P8D2_9PEZI|nr:hypothetical protein LTR77_007289 [Saxophila tyrrhenica]